MIARLNKSDDVEQQLFVEFQATLLSTFLGILLNSPHCPQGHVGLFNLINFCGQRFPCHKLAQCSSCRFHDEFEIVVLFNGKGESRQCDKGVAGTSLEPGIAGKNVALIFLRAVVELMGCIDQTMEEVVAGRTIAHLFVEQLFQPTRLNLRRRRCKDNAFAFLDVHLEIAGNIQVFV